MAHETVLSLHEGLKHRLGRVRSARSINRSFFADRQGTLVWVMSARDPMADHLHAHSGLVVVVDSEAYPLQWVGKVTRITRQQDNKTYRVVAREYRYILSQRYLAPPATYTGAPGLVFRDILRAAGADNSHGVDEGAIANGINPYAASFPNRNAASAMDAVARDNGMEWWLDYDVSPEQVAVTANLAPGRGASHYGHGGVNCGPGGNAQLLQSELDTERSAWRVTLVRGAASALESYSALDRVSVRDGGAGVIHGFASTRSSVDGGSPLSRRDLLLHAEHLKEVGSLSTSAQRLLGAPPLPEMLIQARVRGEDWEELSVGNTVRVRAPNAFHTGFNGPARVLAAQPKEEIGVIDVMLEPREADV